jgi:hypothetical protein
MRIGRKLDSCGSVVGFAPGCIKLSMPGLYYRSRVINVERAMRSDGCPCPSTRGHFA